jgi:hypothetical protein
MHLTCASGPNSGLITHIHFHLMIEYCWGGPTSRLHEGGSSVHSFKCQPLSRNTLKDIPSSLYQLSGSISHLKLSITQWFSHFDIDICQNPLIRSLKFRFPLPLPGSFCFSEYEVESQFVFYQIFKWDGCLLTMTSQRNTEPVIQAEHFQQNKIE